MGVYTGAVDRERFRQITIDYPMALARAVQLVSLKFFCAIEWARSRPQRKSRLMFALDKGIVENQLLSLWEINFTLVARDTYTLFKNEKNPTLAIH